MDAIKAALDNDEEKVQNRSRLQFIVPKPSGLLTSLTSGWSGYREKSTELPSETDCQERRSQRKCSQREGSLTENLYTLFALDLHQMLEELSFYLLAGAF